MVRLVLCLVVLAWSLQAHAAQVSITPATDLQAAITANQAGTAFLLQAGTHRRGNLIPKDGNVFLGAAGAILSGGELLTGWTASGSDWFVGGQTQQGEVLNAGQCAAGFPLCANPEDVFYDGVPLAPVASQAALAPGTFFFDYAADRIYIRDTPTGHTVETSVRARAFEGTAQNVTIQNLTIEKYAAPTQKGAIEVTNSHGWRIENCVMRHNHGRAIHVNGHRWTIRGNTITTNGQLGIAGGGKNLLIEANFIADNNYARLSPGFEAGGTKIVNVRGARLVRNTVQNNYGSGLWCDINCANVLYAHNVVTGNSDQGIFHEISYDAVIRHNTSAHNGMITHPFVFGAQIQLANSERVQVYGNVVRVSVTGGQGIMLSLQAREPSIWGTYFTRYNTVHHNTLHYGTATGGFQDGFTGAVGDVGDIEAHGQVWDYNVFIAAATAGVWVFHDCAPAYSTFPTFQACGYDVHGRRYDP